MKNLGYSAGAVSKGFWFEEFKKYMQLLHDGKTKEEIKKLQEKENIFLAPSKDYGKKIIGEMAKRTRSINEEIIGIFFTLDVPNQKLVNLLGVMMTDRLFFEYIYEVYREDMILGSEKFEDSNTLIFFKNKSEQCEKVEGYTEQTKRRLGTAYKTYLKEANLIEEKDGRSVYRKPIIDLKLEEELKTSSLYPYFKALVGVAQ